MTGAWILGIALSAGAACQAAAQSPRPRRFHLLKPLTTVLLLLAAVSAPEGLWRAPFLVGLGLSLVGDVALLGQGDRAFLVGLGAFLLAHLAFIAGFLRGVPPGWPPLWTLGLVAFAILITRHLWPGVGALRLPVLVYSAVLLAMALAAACAHHSDPNPATRWALAGALCFVLSDTLLASDRFRGPHRGAQPLLLALYWLALGCLVQALAMGPARG